MNNLSKLLLDHIDEERLLNMISSLIRIKSYPGIPAQETEVAKYIKSVMDKYDIPCSLKEVEDGRCNVIATLDSGNPGKTLMLNGHMDTVDPYDMENAFEPVIKEGRIYGRGSSDMKGPLASMMEALIILKETDLLKSGRVIFTGVCGEEEKSIGTIDLIESGITADGAIVGEPTGLEIHTAHRGLEWFKFTFTGKTVHGGAQNEGVNAISKAVDFICAMEKDLIPHVYSKKHPVLKEATVNYGVIHGGTQLSTVAGECELYVDRRFLPYENYDDVLKEFQDLIDTLSARDPKFKCKMEVMDVSVMKKGYVHLPMETPVNHKLVLDIKEAFYEAVEKEPVVSFFPAWTDGGLLYGYGKIPTIIMGPGLIECCHSKEEYMPVDHLSKGAMIYALTAIKFCEIQT